MPACTSLKPRISVERRTSSHEELCTQMTGEAAANHKLEPGFGNEVRASGVQFAKASPVFVRRHSCDTLRIWTTNSGNAYANTWLPTRRARPCAPWYPNEPCSALNRRWNSRYKLSSKRTKPSIAHSACRTTNRTIGHPRTRRTSPVLGSIRLICMACMIQNAPLTHIAYRLFLA